ncbi:hypothetical protein MA12_gp19 [Pectobacterium phage MA12]|uniref:Uncharacterized protein n=1 Tax=Pectobacterium phage MA12 TaxID=2686474 RepID=A0A6B9RH45_9CAUD|nr:hypothetical protein JT357_gp19 [Pectobacterium phage MA12]QHI00846.1 hypothetical protein MA12_gp19 [Pectobacterium phage MA12]
MKQLTMSYVQAVSFFTMGFTNDADKYQTALSLHGGGQIELLESVLPLAVALENVYDAIADHHDNCSVVWGYDVVEMFGEWVADFMADPDNGGSVPDQSAIGYLIPMLSEAFNVCNDVDRFGDIVGQAFRDGLKEV